MASNIRHAIAAALLMLVTSGMAVVVAPTHRLADTWGKLDLEAAIPTSFGEWKPDPRAGSVVVNPEVEATLAKIYTRTLSRTYVNPQGDFIMLSIAYGDDQRDENQAHVPEICYPAQGFQVRAMSDKQFNLRGQSIPVRHVETVQGNRRYEPVMYWTMVGDSPTLRGIHKKFSEMRYTMRGVIPDGLLFRVSSIARDSEAGYALQERFVTELFAHISPANRLRLAGLDK